MYQQWINYFCRIKFDTCMWIWKMAWGGRTHPISNAHWAYGATKSIHYVDDVVIIIPAALAFSQNLFPVPNLSWVFHGNSHQFFYFCQRRQDMKLTHDHLVSRQACCPLGSRVRHISKSQIFFGIMAYWRYAAKLTSFFTKGHLIVATLSITSATSTPRKLPGRLVLFI